MPGDLSLEELSSREVTLAVPARRAQGGEIQRCEIATEVHPIQFLVHNHFDQDHRLHCRDNLKLSRSAALAEWHQITT